MISRRIRLCYLFVIVVGVAAGLPPCSTAARPQNGFATMCPDGTCPQSPVGEAGRFLRPRPIAPITSPGTSPFDVDPQAHCRIYVGDGSIGSGTLIARNDATGLILTCSHLFDGSESNVVVAFSNGDRFGARVTDRDRGDDLAALLIKRPNVEPVPVNDGDPAGLLTACGYGGSGRFRSICGAITGAVHAEGASGLTITLSGAVRPGDSGGGVLDSGGRLVGVVWGCRDGETYLTCGRPLRQFLDRVWPGRSNQQLALRDPAAGSDDLDLAAWRERVDRKLESLAPLGSRIESLRSGIFERVEARIRELLPTIEPKIEAARPGLLSGLSFGKLIAGGLGVTGPVALAIVVAGGLIGGRVKRHRLRAAVGGTEHDDKNLTSPIASRPFPVAIDTPPSPQRTVSETHFVPVEKDSFARAHRWASEQVARKYPGATEVLSTLDSLIRQQLSAQNS